MVEGYWLRVEGQGVVESRGTFLVTGKLLLLQPSAFNSQLSESLNPQPSTLNHFRVVARTGIEPVFQP